MKKIIIEIEDKDSKECFNQIIDFLGKSEIEGILNIEIKEVD